MPKLKADRAIELLAKKYRSLNKAYGSLPEFWGDYSEELADYLVSVLRRCEATPKGLRPKSLSKSKEMDF